MSTSGNAFLTVVDTTSTGAGSLVYSTYLGGASAGFGDWGQGIAVDSFGDAFITGYTTSGGSGPFPTTASAFQSSLNSANGNAFVAEISTTQPGAQGLVYSTYLGGSSTIVVGDSGNALALDQAGKVYVSGDTTSADFPVTTGAFQTTNSAAGRSFLAKLDVTKSGTQSLIYSTFLGGTNGPNGDVANGLAVDPNGDAFVAGNTSSSDFPTTAGALQTIKKSSEWSAFLSELNPTGTGLVYSTFLSGSCSTLYGDLGYGVALDSLGNAYTDGSTCSTDFPVSPPNAYQTSLAGSYNATITQFALLATPSLISISVSPANLTIAVGANQQFSATGTFSDSSTQDLTAVSTWSSSNTSIAIISNPVQTQGVLIALAPGATTMSATVTGVTGNTGVTVVVPVPPPTPSISSVTPANGVAGAQVTITGSGFGTSQGSGYVLVGTALGLVVSWSDTQIVATVAPGSATGMVQVFQGGLQSNGFNFTICNPAILAVSPASGPPGTTVTITGSGFGASQGNGQLWLGNMSGVVNSWSDTQVIGTVAAGASSGNAQILQNGVWSNAIPFSAGVPQITGISPNSGPAGTAVTITGSGFGATQGGGTVWIGSGPGIVAMWCDSKVVASVASGALTGVLRIQQNGIWSNTFAFTVPPADGSSPLTLTPNSIAMLVGNTHSIQALNAQGQSVTGLTWSSSDTTIVTLSTDDPPILTAVAGGRATISAGNASADITVYAGSSLPPGTVQWTNPGDGSGIYSIVPAVPSSSGVDVFAFQGSGTVAAITADGTALWTAPSNGGSPIADFNGGLVIVTPQTIQSLNGATGQSYPPYTSTYGALSANSVAVSTDGTTFALDGDQVVGIDPSTGVPKFSLALDDSVHEVIPGCVEAGRGSVGFPSVYQFSIAGDGYVYVLYSFTTGLLEYTGCNQVSDSETLQLRLLRVGLDGSSSKIDVGAWTQSSEIIIDPLTNITDTQAGVIPDLSASLITFADSGVVASVGLYFPAYCPYLYDAFKPTGISICLDATASSGLTTVSAGVAAPAVLTGQSFQPVLQREDGSYVGNDSYGNMVAFDTSGNVKWSVPNYLPELLTDDGGVAAQSYDGLTSATFDANGNVTGQAAIFAAYSWTGESYAVSAGMASQIAPGTIILDEGSLWAEAGGNPSDNGTATAQCGCFVQSTDSTVSYQPRPLVPPLPFGRPVYDGRIAHYEAASLRLTDRDLPFRHLRTVTYRGASETEAIAEPQPAPQGPANCPVCNLTPPSCLAVPGSGPTFVILVGDPGTAGRYVNHNVGNAFNVSAQTQANSLQAQGYNVFACRVSSVQDVDAALTQHGLIGGVSYFGHSGPYALYSGNQFVGQLSILAVGQATGFYTNIRASNVSILANVQQAYTGPQGQQQNILGPSASITLNGCAAGQDIYDYDASAVTSIAQLISNQTRTEVYAYKIGVYFSQKDAVHATSATAADEPNLLPSSPPMYMIPIGAPGRKPPPTPFMPK